ncbi:hypothetical protein F3157_08125 [Virgibacillus dakarensis]|uniref:Uncharacterized protein n=1 Tax=Lentibacillus populi TaxID=1827502 RepID=A0A9W5TX78_9BACI|nr:hypothetical protein [Lentibacillus populi]MTW85628.1 hypothetical protein [Virgibacillus dakarensis]GGB41745.1 hypothetical protein GCM10011409_19110 [Lentibacillus populi]
MDMTLEREREQAEHEKAKMYIQYLSNIFSRPQEGKPDPKFIQAKREFERLLMPENRPEKGSTKTYEWDFDPNEVLEQQTLIEGR